MRKRIFTLLVLIVPMASGAATSGLGSWFKKNIADPVTDASKVIYEAAADGVENVYDRTRDVVVYTYRTAANGISYVHQTVSNTSEAIWEVTADGVVYVGEKIWDGTKWVGGKIMDGKRWLEAEFKGNTEGTMTFRMPVALSRDGSSYIATQIFGLEDFSVAKSQFNSFQFNEAFLEIPAGLGSGNLSWTIECFGGTACSPFPILSGSFSPGQKLVSTDPVWKSRVNDLLARGVPEAIMVFRIDGYAGTPEHLDISFGFEAGMKGVK